MYRNWNVLALAIALGFTISACEETPMQTDPIDVATVNAGVDLNTWVEGGGEWYDMCVGEIYDYTMRYHFITYEHNDASGGNHIVAHTNLHYVGIGRDSGIQYVGQAPYKTVMNTPSSGTETYSSHWWDKASSQGNAPNTREISWVEHVTVNAYGEVTAVKLEPYEVRCGGAG